MTERRTDGVAADDLAPGEIIGGQVASGDGNGAPAGPVAGRGGLAQAIAEEFSAQASVGGTRGLLEAVLPLTVFSMAYALTGNVRGCVAAALVPAAVLAAWRLLAREPVTQAVSGLLVLALGGFIAVRTGRAENLFVPQLVKNLAFGTGLAVSALVRWPLVGLGLGLLRGEGTAWRGVPGRMHAYTRATWVWVGMFGVRLLVEVPLWLAGAAVLLGLANIPLGLPLYAATLWVTWRLVRDEPATESVTESDAGAG